MLPEDSCRTNNLKDGAGGGRTATTFPSAPREGSAHCGKQMSCGAQSNNLERQTQALAAAQVTQHREGNLFGPSRCSAISCPVWWTQLMLSGHSLQKLPPFQCEEHSDEKLHFCKFYKHYNTGKVTQGDYFVPMVGGCRSDWHSPRPRPLCREEPWE